MIRWIILGRSREAREHQLSGEGAGNLMESQCFVRKQGQNKILIP